MLACTLFRFKFKHILHKHFNIQFLHLTLSLLSLPLPPARLSTQPPLQHNKTLSLLFAQFQIRFFFACNVDIIRISITCFLPHLRAVSCFIPLPHKQPMKTYTVRFTNLHIHSSFLCFFIFRFFSSLF